MRKLGRILTGACAGAAILIGSANAQLQDEQNVTITMDLQPILQLKMDGPDQLDFTFDEINEYYAGIVKYGATQLKVSSTVSFDLWAAGLSNGENGNFLWDNPVEYQSATSATDDIPVTALELRQTPANPAVAAGCANVVANSSDYSLALQPANGTSNNTIYSPSPATPYTAPTSTALAGTSEKYIAGGTGTVANCQVAGGSYLTQGTLGTSNYYYVIDYRIVPDLPVTFPFGDDANVTNATAPYVVAADGAAAALYAAGAYAQPGVYTMYVKYILAQDQ